MFLPTAVWRRTFFGQPKPNPLPCDRYIAWFIWVWRSVIVKITTGLGS
ncbi:hypothetical protein EJK54_0404 [Moraxella catarrhalis]|uniref:Uncharacterized protein n=1 Tax=Moraxella catarrhalis TaxID=480 RepID=A0ABY0BLA4_MORCA|nr:hypothetical protein MCR_1872 [Moraxella catarrhalis BBH18]AZQ89713.1 hypothetical protein EJK50_2026 [Moraxella catarrhalis]RUO16615.1 hypothetical protein EJK54_0404 [Moraxella catarrhalis]